MALATLILACLLFYSTSKYFPFEKLAIVRTRKYLVIGVACTLAFSSFYLFIIQIDFATALMIWMIAFMTILSAMIISLKISFHWIWMWGALSLFFVVIDTL